MRVYGLKNCDSCRKACRELDAAGADYSFTDVREDGVKLHQIENWVAAVGAETLVNRRSTTWRSLSSEEKEQALGDNAAHILSTWPTLIKRPVIEDRSRVFVGWTDAVKAALL